MGRKRSGRLFNPAGSGSYDKFFVSHSRPTTIQCWGLAFIGLSLLVSGLLLLIVGLGHLADSPRGWFEGITLGVLVAICCSFIYFGVMHLRRAFEGRR